MNGALQSRFALACAAGLVLLIIGEMTLLDVGGAVAPSPPPAAMPAQTAAIFSPANAVETILSRPLFQPGRRPPGGALPMRGDTALPRLTGLVVDGDRRIAVFQPAGDKPVELKEGDSIAGWTIQTIGHRQVVLQKPGGTMTIEPAKEMSGAAAAIGQTPRRGPYSGQAPVPRAARP
jgi:general secretion pathway protein N